MDSRAVAFIEVMAAIAIVGVVSFLIFLVSRQALRSTSGGRNAAYQPQWYELLLAAVFVAAVAIVVVWQVLSDGDWGDDGRALTFFVVMLIIGGGALAVFVLSMLWRLSRAVPAPGQGPVASTTTRAVSDAAPAPQEIAKHKAPSAMRLVGVLGFAAVFLIFNWSHVENAQRHVMMLNLIYPAGLVIALVMLFDKASRAWDVKSPGEGTREWLYANALMVLYLLGYLNLLGVADTAAYAGMLWDMVHVAAFLLVLWVIDRKATRLRFLLLHAYLILLPILLLIWQNQMGVVSPEGISWWETIWPFFFLAIVFFVLELIIVIATPGGGGQGVATLKDVVFLVLYVILLIGAQPEVVA